jgi:hypothetical protein
MIGTRFYRGPINGLDSVLPGANSERALTESWRAREPLTPAKGGVRWCKAPPPKRQCNPLHYAQVIKEGKGQASKFAFGRLACWFAPCEARVPL